MRITEEMVRGIHPSSPCRACLGKECPFDSDELASLDCLYMQRHLAEIDERMEGSGAKLHRIGE